MNTSIFVSFQLKKQARKCKNFWNLQYMFKSRNHFLLLWWSFHCVMIWMVYKNKRNWNIKTVKCTDLSIKKVTLPWQQQRWLKRPPPRLQPRGTGPARNTFFSAPSLLLQGSAGTDPMCPWDKNINTYESKILLTKIYFLCYLFW